MRAATTLLAMFSLLLASCGGGGGDDEGNEAPPALPGFQVPALVNLTEADIGRILAQGVNEAQARGFAANIVVIDRVGNVLAAFAMNGANPNARIPDAPNLQNDDLQGVTVPAMLAAISKALTASYFSSVGGAFSSRTANDIVQQNFPPSQLTTPLESGPLFSVQFSQLPCSDVSQRFPARNGTHRGPLGVGADPGAFPLYKNGAVVGSVAVEGDGVYGFDPEFRDVDNANANPEEVIALAATTGFEPLSGIRADRISIDGTILRYSDAKTSDFVRNPASAPPFASLVGTAGTLPLIRGYYAGGVIVPGTTYGAEDSGIRPSNATDGYNNGEIWVVSDGLGNTRYLPKDGTDAGTVAQPLTAAEVRSMLVEAFAVQRRARAQVRRPLDSRAQNTIAVVDTNGEILGLIRGPDALVDAIDAVPQKARTTAFFSNPVAASDLSANTDPKVPPYVTAVQAFFNDPTVLNGRVAFSGRAIGNISRPRFPDADANVSQNGPLSVPLNRFSIFSTGLQSTLITPDIVAHVNFVVDPSAPTDVPQICNDNPIVPITGRNRINNGITLFAGGVPIYRGTQLIGAIAASGDGDDQSDMIAFLGLYNASQRPGATFNLPPKNPLPNLRRSDQFSPGSPSQQLAFITCPFAPFIDTSEQNVCQGK